MLFTDPSIKFIKKDNLTDRKFLSIVTYQRPDSTYVMKNKPSYK